MKKTVERCEDLWQEVGKEEQERTHRWENQERRKSGMASVVSSG